MEATYSHSVCSSDPQILSSLIPAALRGSQYTFGQLREFFRLVLCTDVMNLSFGVIFSSKIDDGEGIELFSPESYE